MCRRHQKRGVKLVLHLTDSRMMLQHANMKKKRRGGWPKRERKDLFIRVSPATLEWLDGLREHHRLTSRSATAERILDAVRSAYEAVDKVPDDLHPSDLLAAVGGEFVESFVDAGFLGHAVGRAVEFVRAERGDNDEAR